MRAMTLAIAVALQLGAGAAHAQSAGAFDIEGYLDLRAAAVPDETSWLDGGLGKTRFGDGDDGLSGSAALTATFQVTPALLAKATVQYQPELEHKLDVLEAYLRYRPVSITPWRWALKAGAFLPPISLEHDGIAWSTTRTLTPSALNTWVGEELRIFGAELHIEHRGRYGTLDARFAAFLKNDPAGELLASRGWVMGDVASGIDASLRQPDVHAAVARAPVPVRFRPFVEMDDHPGYYGGVGWQPSSQRRFTALYYDNHAELDGRVRYSGRTVRAWRTYFWSLGADQTIGDWVLLGQAMHGSTIFEPVPGRLILNTGFNAGYLLLTRDYGAWQPALRGDLFQSRQRPAVLSPPLSEHGHALTFALNWRPRERLRITGEILRIDSVRDQRRRGGEDPRQIDVQVQLGARVFF